MRAKDRPDVDAVLANRHAGGADYWSTPDGKVGVGSPFSTLESLLLLHELRVSRTHEAVQGAMGLLFDGWRDDGRFRVAPKGSIYPCHTASVARVLCRFGAAKDPRLKATLELLLAGLHDDGGWRCSRTPMGRKPETDRSNPGVTLNALDAFRFTSDGAELEALGPAVDTLLEHWTVKRPLGPCAFGIGTLFGQIEYPFLRYNLFAYVYVLSFYPQARGDERFGEALAMLRSKLDEQQRLVVERPHRKLGDLVLCAAGQPSELATARYREIEANLQA